MTQIMKWAIIAAIVVVVFVGAFIFRRPALNLIKKARVWAFGKEEKIERLRKKAFKYSKLADELSANK